MPDVIAGLTAAAVVVPKAMAYATIAGLPVQVGLYTALVPMVIYALLGTSRAERQHHHHDRDPLRRRARRRRSGGEGAQLIGAAATLAVLVGVMLTVAWCCGSASWPTSSPSRC